MRERKIEKEREYNRKLYKKFIFRAKKMRRNKRKQGKKSLKKPWRRDGEVVTLKVIYIKRTYLELIRSKRDRKVRKSQGEREREELRNRKKSCER